MVSEQVRRPGERSRDVQAIIHSRTAGRVDIAAALTEACHVAKRRLHNTHGTGATRQSFKPLMLLLLQMMVMF